MPPHNEGAAPPSPEQALTHFRVRPRFRTRHAKGPSRVKSGFFKRNPGVLINDDPGGRSGRFHYEKALLSSQERNIDLIPRHHRQALKDFGKLLKFIFFRQCAGEVEWSDQHRLGCFTGDFSYPDQISQACLAIAASDPVNLDYLFPVIFRKGPRDPGDRCFFSPDLNRSPSTPFNALISSASRRAHPLPISSERASATLSSRSIPMLQVSLREGLMNWKTFPWGLHSTQPCVLKWRVGFVSAQISAHGTCFMIFTSRFVVVCLASQLRIHGQPNLFRPVTVLSGSGSSSHPIPMRPVSASPSPPHALRFWQRAHLGAHLQHRAVPDAPME